MNNFVLINIPDLRSRKFAGKSLLQFDWFDLKWQWYDWSITCTDKEREWNVVQKKAAIYQWLDILASSERKRFLVNSFAMKKKRQPWISVIPFYWQVERLAKKIGSLDWFPGSSFESILSVRIIWFRHVSILVFRVDNCNPQIHLNILLFFFAQYYSSVHTQSGGHTKTVFSEALVL